MLFFLTGFPVVRGSVDLLRVSKWTDSTCKTVDLPPYRFYPDKQVHVQVSVNHMKLNDSVTVHDAVTSWTERVNTENFTVCVMQTGRNSGESLNPFATVDWLAYQGAPPEGMAGTIKMQKWWSGTKCAHVAFPKVKREDKLLNYKYVFRRISRVRPINFRDGSKLCNWGGWVSTVAQT